MECARAEARCRYRPPQTLRRVWDWFFAVRMIWYICQDPTKHEKPKSFWVAADQLEDEKLDRRQELFCPYCEALCRPVPEGGHIPEAALVGRYKESRSGFTRDNPPQRSTKGR